MAVEHTDLMHKVTWFLLWLTYGDTPTSKKADFVTCSLHTTHLKILQFQIQNPTLHLTQLGPYFIPKQKSCPLS